tara:strand:+ start:342 stop:803 length:462 start_codon:yes stop_codon:yes gene_type:complete
MTAFTVLSLRSALEATISSNLGTYTLANGTTTPAVTVREYGEAPPPGQTVTGLEMVIIRSPELNPLLQQENEVAFQTWNVFLVDWAGGTNLEECAGRLIWAFPGTTAVRIDVPAQLGPKNQMRVDIRSMNTITDTIFEVVYEPDVYRFGVFIS